MQTATWIALIVGLSSGAVIGFWTGHYFGFEDFRKRSLRATPERIDFVRWAYRKLLGREAESDAVVSGWAESRHDERAIAQAIANGREFQQKDAVVQAAILEYVLDEIIKGSKSWRRDADAIRQSLPPAREQDRIVP